VAETEPLWRWRELCEALGIAICDGPDVSGISIDSRTLKPGDLFIALTGDPGSRFNPSQRSDRDGHSYIGKALERGAAGVLVHDQQPRDCPQLPVADTLDALWDLGRAGRARLQCPVVAITGSSGKTTTKAMLAAALGAFSTAGSLNNHLGVPLSLARSPRSAGSAVYEVGTNHPGEIAPLSRLVAPDVAVVLNVHPAHAANFSSLAELRTEKLSIAAGLGSDGTLVVEDLVDDAEVADEIRRLRFGNSASADVQLLGIDGLSASYQISGREFTAHIPGGGTHRARSLAAVLTVLLALQRDPAAACSLDDALLPVGRGTSRMVAGIELIDDSYNANPESMKAALDSLRVMPGRRFALLGEMLELGADSARYHTQLSQHCEGLDGVFCVGEGMRVLADTLPPDLCRGHWPGADKSLVTTLSTTLHPGDKLLIKGSNKVFWAAGFVDQLAEALSG